MSTRREFDHIGNYRFMVEIEGIAAGAFSRVDGLESKTDVISFFDGDSALIRKRPGRTHYSNITLYKGFTNNSALWGWRETVMDGRVARKSGSIILLDETRQEIMRYNFFEAWPCRWKSMQLDAADDGLVIEELELVVEKIERA